MVTSMAAPALADVFALVESVPDPDAPEPLAASTPDGDLTVEVRYGDNAGIPAGSTLEVRPIDGEEANQYVESGLSAVGGGKAVLSRFVDISILSPDGEEIHPAEGEYVVLIGGAEMAPEGATLHVVHFEEKIASSADADEELYAEEDEPLASIDRKALRGAGLKAGMITLNSEADGLASVRGSEIEEEIFDDVVENSVEEDNLPAENEIELNPVEIEDVNQAGGMIAFVTPGFSVFGLIYTVDFEYSVDGKMYQFSLPGGGFVSLTDLIEVLGIPGDTSNEDNEEKSETVEARDSNGMLDVTAGDAAKKFVADIASVEFSSPELVWVGKTDHETTVGGLKKANGLDCQYSAELTEEQIAEINGIEVHSGDWALISVQPFASEESLTVTMKDSEVFTIHVTDAQIFTHIMTAKGERFRITVTFDEEAKIPEGSVLVAEEIPEGSEKYEKYLEETSAKWEEAEREGYISFARFFDVEIRKDGAKIEPETAVEVEIVHDDGLALFEDESLSVIHFAESGTEIIDEIHRNEDGTEVVYEQDGFSVIGTVSTVKDNGWPTSNGQYVLVLQDGDDYYALKQDGSLAKVRYFNNTVSFIGEGTTTTDYIEDYLWYVVSSGNRGKISDKYTEYNATPDGQTFIDPNNPEILSGTSRQLQIRDGKIYCSGQLPGSSSYTQVTLSASDGQLSRVALTSDSASPVLFATASSFTANDNETDLFTQIEVESIINKWREQKTKESSCGKTAEVYDYENRIYQVDITASSSDYEVAPSIALEFVVDASRSMFFPTSVTEVGTFSGTNASNVRDWINAHGNTDQVYFVIQNKNGAATQYAIFYDPNSEYWVNEGYYYYGRWIDNWVLHTGRWRWVDASNYNPPDDVANGGVNNTRTEGGLLDDWTWGNMDDGKIYTTGITGSSTGTYGERKTWISRIEYLKQCARVASQVIYAVDENAQI